VLGKDVRESDLRAMSQAAIADKIDTSIAELIDQIKRDDVFE
jgi:hypothetical protein